MRLAGQLMIGQCQRGIHASRDCELALISRDKKFQLQTLSACSLSAFSLLPLVSGTSSPAFPHSRCKMSLLSQPLAAEAGVLAMKEMDTELVYLLEAAKVPGDIIAMIGSLGYTEMETFAHMESEAKEVRRVLKEDVGLDPAKGPQHRSMSAKLLACWEAAGKRSQRRTKRMQPSVSATSLGTSRKPAIWSWCRPMPILTVNSRTESVRRPPTWSGGSSRWRTAS